MTTVTLIRHGETVWNRLGRWQGIAPVPLSENGEQQAKQSSQALLNTGITHIISSDLYRTRQTADLLNTSLNLPISLDKRWREIDVGRWQGLTMDEIKQYDYEAYTAYQEAPFIDRVFPEGEIRYQQSERVVVALNALLQKHTDEHILVVTHGGSIQCLLHHLTGFDGHHSANCAITKLRYTDTWEILAINKRYEPS